jgi:RND family efflux transporter MFP subunit
MIGAPGGGAAAAPNLTPGAASTAAHAAAVIGAVASEPVDFWSLLVNARTSDELCRAWLGILCQWVPGTQAGLLLLHEAVDRYAPAAVWPDAERDMSFLADVAQQALVERRGVVLDESSGLAQCAYPLVSADKAFGVVVLHVAARGPAPLRDALRLLHWGAGWLVGLFDRRDLLDRDQRLKSSALLQDLLLGALAETDAPAAARWVANRVVEALPCRQAMVGRAGDDGIVKLLSVSGSAGFEPRSNLLSAAAEAMTQAVLSGELDQHPPAGADADMPLLATSPLADYNQEAGAAGSVVVAFEHQGRRTGALLVDFDGPPSAETVEFLRTLGAALAPAFELQRGAQRGLVEHAADSSRSGLRSLFGPSHPGLKLLAGAAAVLLVVAALLPLPYRVGAPAIVEGLLQRAAVAPFAGFIQESRLRAGDTVKAGDVLARLDDRDLKLEAARWSAQAELAERKLREAMARGTPAALMLARAEADEAAAELALSRSKLARVEIKAPFDGVVVRGDLSQQLGAPVEQGKVLFEVVPMAAWRVVLKIDERDILQIREGATGELVLSGLPGVRHTIVVSRIALVAVAEDGLNTFRVEAQVQGGPALIQPGMEGVGKINAGERSALWISSHRLVDWLGFVAWKIGF